MTQASDILRDRVTGPGTDHANWPKSPRRRNAFRLRHGRHCVIDRPSEWCCSTRTEQMFGITAAEAWVRYQRFMPERFRGAHTRHIRSLEEPREQPAHGRPGTVCGIRANGEEFPIEASISQV